MKLLMETFLTAIFLIASGLAYAAGGGSVTSDAGAMQGKHFDPKGKPPSAFTVDQQQQLRKSLPFDDARDFEEQKKGFIAAPSYKQIKAATWHGIWAATNSYCRAKISIVSTHRYNARPSST